MKLSELSPCASCNGPIVPIWYVLRFSVAMLDRNATNSTLGLIQHFGGFGNHGSLAIAEAMSPNPDCVKVLGDEEPSLMVEVNICQNCFISKELNIAVLMESAHKEVTGR